MRPLLLLPLLLTGCGLCGTYTVATGYTLSGDPIDGSYTESCGPNSGTWGSWNLFGDDRAQLYLGPTGHGDLTLNEMIIDMEVDIPLERMVPGEVIAAEDLYGYAGLSDMGGNSYAVAGLKEGQVEVLSDRSDSDDPCTAEGGNTWDGPTYVLRWDLTFHGEQGDGIYDYTAQGKDRVGFDTFLSESCGGWDY